MDVREKNKTMGFLLILPIGIPIVMAIGAINYSAKGRGKRALGIILCPLSGGLSVAWGWLLAFGGFPEGSSVVTYPVAGVTAFVCGIIIGLFGTIRAATTKNEIYWGDGVGGVFEGLMGIVIPQKDRRKSIELVEPYIETSKCVGDLRTGQFHNLNCRLIGQIEPENMAWFSSVAEAESADFVQCEACKLGIPNKGEI